jgi:hypothetical protein
MNDMLLRKEMRNAEGLTDAAFFNATAQPDAAVALTNYPTEASPA